MSPDAQPPSSSEQATPTSSPMAEDDFESSSWSELPESWQQATDYALIPIVPVSKSGRSSNSKSESSERSPSASPAPSADSADPLEWLVQDLLDQFPGMSREQVIQRLNDL